ncbi:MAG: hypothetical protein WD749_13920 [Phycisphaerales bacterium]
MADRAPRWTAGRRTRLIDARGRVLPLCEPRQLPSGAASELRRAVVAANQHRVVPILTWCAVFVGGQLVLQALVGGGRAGTMFNSLSQAASFIAGIALVLPFSIVVESGRARRRGIAAMENCMRYGLCPSCCYDLTDMAPDREGFVVCPECGGSWRIRLA